jgi:hypothetical protein
VYNAWQSAENQASHMFHAGFLFALFFDPEDRGDMFFRNVGLFSTDYAALYPTRQNSSFSLLWEPQILYNLQQCSRIFRGKSGNP